MSKDEILGEDLKFWKTGRPYEWTMDRFVKSAEKLQAENERLKAELADSLPLEKVRGMVSYCETNRADTRCQASCPYDKLCEFLGDLTSFLDSAVPSLEQYVKEVRGE